MSHKHKTKPAPEPVSYAETKLKNAARIIEVIETLRGRNADGYMQHVGGLLVKFKSRPGLPFPPKCSATTCSPFTATVIGAAFDPNFPAADDLGTEGSVPMCDDGKKELPFHDFYSLHNANDSAVKSVEKYNLGKEIPIQQMRRGDLLEIGWSDGGGHAVFCWDVHLDADGNVDAFQFVGSNSYNGVSIHGCGGKPWITGTNSKLETTYTEEVDKTSGKTKKVAHFKMSARGDLAKGIDPLFVETDDIAQWGHWYAIPGVKKVDSTTFKAQPQRKIIYEKKLDPKDDSSKYTVAHLKCARLHYDGEPPAPSNMSDSPPLAKSTVVGHTDGPVTVVKHEEVQQNPSAPKKVPPKPVKQEKKASPLDFQHFVEFGLRALHDAGWIKADPGKSEDINDGASQAALKEFQTLFGLKVDGILGWHSVNTMNREFQACGSTTSTQMMLKQLFDGKKIEHDPGPADGTNNAQTKAAVDEVQAKYGLKATGIPDFATQKKIIEVLQDHAPTPEKPGLAPVVEHLYWVGNTVDVGGTAKLRIHAKDLIVGQQCAVQLLIGDDTIDAGVKLVVDGAQADVSIPIPAKYARGTSILAHVIAELAEEGTLEATTKAALVVMDGSESVDWRPYIGKDSVPDDVLDAIRRNRQRYPQKDEAALGLEPEYIVHEKKKIKNKWAGAHHYDYKSTKSHKKWAEGWAQKKIDEATATGDRKTLHVAQAYLHMLSNEGLPASMNTYDNQIITWGVGLGGLGDGKEAFRHMHKDPTLKKLLNDIGFDFDTKAVAYYVVDLEKKKVIASVPPDKSQGENLGTDTRHVVPLEAVRRQLDLLSAIIGLSEDAATRDAVMDSQWQVYLSNSTQWGGQEKIETLSLFFMVTHMHQWLPAVANGVSVSKVFDRVGGNAPSKETDKAASLQIAQAFIAYAKVYHDKIAAQNEVLKAKGIKKLKHNIDFDDVHTRTKTRLWEQYRTDAKGEGYDPGAFVYAD